MKAISGFIVACLVASASAFASSAVGTGESDLYKFQVDPRLGRIGTAVGGNVRVDELANTVTLNVDFRIVCPEGRMCIAVVPSPLEVELPIVSVETDGCGARHITALRDEMPVDGVREQIKVVDFSKVVCKYLAPAPTFVTYETAFYNRVEAQLVETESTFYGQALK